MSNNSKTRFLWLFVLLSFFQLIGQINVAVDEDEQKKQAEMYFQEEEYGQAYKLFTTLLANYPKDPKYNYRIGVCILFVGDEKGDRKNAISYLEFAKKFVSDLDKEVIFYLGKAYHLTYRFDDAIRTYTEYKSIASASNQRKLKVDREIESAKNGKKLLSRIKELVVLEKKRLNIADYFKSYDQRFYGGNLIVKPDQFVLPGDKKKKDKFILFQSKDRNVVLFSSYGQSGEHGKDIYMSRRLPDGNFDVPVPVPGFVNTDYDEDYPYLHPNGKDLFFCSKGHTSMGGYDIFKSHWSEANKSWGRPENMNFPINTPYDDIQFVSDSSEQLAIFSSSRISEFGKIDVYKIKVEPRSSQFAIIKGSVMQKIQGASVKSRITIKDMEGNENIGNFTADEKGGYNLKLPNGGKFIFTVETPGFATQSEGVTVPASFDIRPLRQLITYESNKLIIQNFFDDKDDENSYEDLLALLQEKQNMNVNADKFATADPVVKNTDPEIKKDTKDPDETVKKNITNAELIEMAKKDLEETNKEASDLKVQSDNSTNIAINIDNIADKKEQEANDAMNAAKNISNQKDKEAALEIAGDKKKEADNTRELAIKAQNIAAKLKVEADNKAKESKLQEQFLKNMEDVNKSPTNKEKLAALEKTEKELRDLQEKNRTDENNDLANTTNAEIEQKQTELTNLKKQEDGVKKDITQIDSEIKDKQEELKGTKEKDLRENINAELVNLEAEKKEKETNLKDTRNKITSTETYIENKQSESNFEKTLLNQAKVGNTDVTDLVAKNVTQINEEKTNDTQNQVTDSGQNIANQSTNENNKTENVYVQKENKIKEELTNISTNEKSKENLERKVEILKTWNNTLDEKVAADKEELKTATDKVRKEEIKKEIKQAEEKKKENIANINLALKEAKTAPTDAEITAKNTANTAVADSAGNKNQNVNEEDAASGKTFEKKEDALKTQLTNFNSSEQTKENIDKKISVLEDYNKTIDEQIAADRSALKKEKDAEKKKQITEEIKKLETTKKENLTAIATAAKDKKTAPTNAEVALKTNNNNNNNNSNELVNNGQNKNPNLNQNTDSLQNSNQNKNLNADTVTDNAQNVNNENKSPNNVLIADDSQNGNGTVNNKNPNNNSNTAVTNDNSGVQASIDQKNNLADDLQAQAKQKRADAKNKTGEEKKKLLAESAELEKKSKSQRVEAVAEEVALREKQSENNLKTIEELKELSKDVKGSDITQANKLETEIKSLMNKASKMRDEANKETDLNTKLGGLTNADETEHQAILKQNEAIAIYQKRNPDYIVSNGTQNKNSGSNLSNNSEQNGNTNQNKNPGNNQLTDNGQNENQNTNQNKNPGNNQLTDNGQNENQNTNQNKNPGNNRLNDNGQNGNQNTNQNKNSDNNQLTDNGQNGNQNTNQNKNSDNNQLTDIGQNENQNSNGNRLNSNAANLSPQKVEAIKSSPEYKKYETYSKKADEAMANVKRDEDQAKQYISKATEQLKESNDLRIKADGMPNGEEKNNTRKKAIELEHQAMADKSKSDSLNELASNTKAYAMEQQQLADNYVSTLDQKKQNDILAVSGSKTNVSMPNAGTNMGCTDNFKNAIGKNDREIESFKTAEKNEQNLNAQNIVLKNYIRDIEKEIIDQRKKLEIAQTQEEKNKIESLLSDLKNKRKDTKNLLTVNEEELKKVKAASIAGNNSSTNLNGNLNTTNDNASGSANTVAVIASNGLKVNKNNAYSSANPIPIDQKWPEGIIYTVQIGAFKTAVPNDIFKGLNPVVGTTAPSGFIRYQAGQFNKFNEANAAKNDVRKLGFKDAFVAVYKNGFRIPLSQVQQESGDNIVADNNTSLGITLNNNTPNGNNIIIPDNNQALANVTATETSQVNGLFYTVQIGVYGNNVPASKLLNLSPVNRELIASGNYRYSAGVYNNLDKVKSDRQKVNDLGIKDAFVTVYLNGKRITFNEASQIQNAGNVQFSNENPIRFPNGGNTTVNETPVVTGENITVNNSNNNGTNNNLINGVQPFTNGVINDPAATPENGVKLTAEGIVYKVQLGAYSKQVPENVSQNWMKVRTWPIRNYVRNNLYIYTIGSFGDFSNAKKLLDESKALGMNDAFITVFKDGNRLGFAEAAQYMR